MSDGWTPVTCEESDVILARTQSIVFSRSPRRLDGDVTVREQIADGKTLLLTYDTAGPDHWHVAPEEVAERWV